MQNPDFERIGKRLFSEGLVSANFGNISVRKGDEGFFIKRAGAYLDTPGDPIFVPMEGDVPKEASSEYRVHRAVYKKSPHAAVIHAHPPYAVAISLVFDEVIPKDSEGEMFCPIIPIVKGRPRARMNSQKMSYRGSCSLRSLLHGDMGRSQRERHLMKPMCSRPLPSTPALCFHSSNG